MGQLRFQEPATAPRKAFQELVRRSGRKLPSSHSAAIAKLEQLDGQYLKTQALIEAEIRRMEHDFLGAEAAALRAAITADDAQKLAAVTPRNPNDLREAIRAKVRARDAVVTGIADEARPLAKGIVEFYSDALGAGRRQLIAEEEERHQAFGVPYEPSEIHLTADECLVQIGNCLESVNGTGGARPAGLFAHLFPSALDYGEVWPALRSDLEPSDVKGKK